MVVLLSVHARQRVSWVEDEANGSPLPGETLRCAQHLGGVRRSVNQFTPLCSERRHTRRKNAACGAGVRERAACARSLTLAHAADTIVSEVVH